MNRTASSLAFACSVAAATIAATAMTGTARAESPAIDTQPFVSTRSVADVRGETRAARATLSSAGNEWVTQQNDPLPASGLARMDARNGYISAREEVLARGSELGGPAFARGSASRASMLVAEQPAR
jgi:hypothetical protein